MKGFKIYIPLALFGMFTLLSATLRSNGSPGKKTGSPLDGGSCTDCHGGAVSTVNWISTNIPTSGYNPGETYVVTAEALGSTPRIGFEITAENGSAKQGTFAVTDASRTKLTNASKAITHTLSGLTPSAGKNTWEMNWTAPAAGTGNVTFYAAFNVADGNGGTSGDQIFASTLQVSENLSTNVNNVSIATFTVTPNPNRGNFTIQSEETILRVDMYSLTGQHIQSLAANQRQVTVNISNQTPGMYLVKISTEKGQWVQKVKVQ